MAVLWPFPVDWANGYKVSLTFLTDVVTSRTGREQRQALRATPRRRVEFTSQPSKTAFQAFKRLVAKSQDDEILMPDPVRYTTVAETAASGTSDLVLGALPGWAIPGRWLILSSGTATEQTQILSIDGTTLTLAGPLAATWPAGSRLTAGMNGRLAAEITWSEPTSTVAEVRVAFDVTPGSEALLGLSAAETFNSRELFALRPNWKDGASLRSLRERGMVDYEIGLNEIFKERDFTTTIREAVWLGASTAEIEALQDFFERARGRQGEFYAPTWEDDITPADPLEAGDDVLRVAGSEFHAAYAGSTVHKAIVVVRKSGAKVVRKVSSITTSGGDTVITLTATWPADIALENIQMVCWAPVCRFATDEILIDYITSEVANVRMSHMTLEDLTPET